MNGSLDDGGDLLDGPAGDASEVADLVAGLLRCRNFVETFHQVMPSALSSAGRYPLDRLQRPPVRVYLARQRKDFGVSDRVAIGQAVEAELGSRQGGDRRSADFQCGPSSTLVGGKTRDLAAARSGFESGKQYERAKKIVDHGTPELIAATDAGDRVSTVTDTLGRNRTGVSP